MELGVYKDEWGLASDQSDFFGSNLVCWSQAKQRSKKYLPSGLFIRPTQTVITIYLVLRHFQKEIWVNLGVVLHTAVLVHSGHCERHSYTQGFWSWWGARKTYSHHCYGNNHVMKTTTWVRQSCSLGWSVQLFGGDGSGAGPGTMGRVYTGTFLYGILTSVTCCLLHISSFHSIGMTFQLEEWKYQQSPLDFFPEP